MRIEIFRLAVAPHRQMIKRNFCISLLLSILTFESSAQLQVGGSGSGGSVRPTGTTLIDPNSGQVANASKLEGNISYQTFMTISAGGGLKLPDMKNIEGSPFLHSEYQSAYVRVRSGYSAIVPVKFNIYGNEIIFVRNGNELALDSVDYVSYLGPKPGGGVQNIQLKTGYPSIGKNDRNTIYQVLDSGISIQLLKFTSQTIEEIKSMGVNSTKQFATKEEFYIYTPSGGIKKIKLDKKSVIEALPEHADRIEAITAQKNMKLKKESELVELIKALSSAKGF